MSGPIRQKPDNMGEISKYIAVPNEEIKLSDGRAFGIKEWHPHVTADDLVTITVKMVPKAPDENENETTNKRRNSPGSSSEVDIFFECPYCGYFIHHRGLNKQNPELWGVWEGKVFHKHTGGCKRARWYECEIKSRDELGTKC